MNWNAKDRSEIALNRIWSEHVRDPGALEIGPLFFFPARTTLTL